MRKTSQRSKLSTALSPRRIEQILQATQNTRILVVGDVMLDHFVWGRVSRISPEAPVPIVDFERESFMPGGAANVARNLTSLGGRAGLCGLIGPDSSGTTLKRLLGNEGVETTLLVTDRAHPTTTKTRIIAGQQQITRLDRDPREPASESRIQQLLRRIESSLDDIDSVIVADYAKGVVTQPLIDTLRTTCRKRGCWFSIDPKPTHSLSLNEVSLLTPNRKEAFELAGMTDPQRHANPLEDVALLKAADRLLQDLAPAILLITLGELGMLLCQKGIAPYHIHTAAREVFDVSGAGDTVIASFTLAIATGASPLEAAEFSNLAAGVVVGKRGTATVTPAELRASFGIS